VATDQREIALAKEALAVQDACNVSGVVHTFSRAMIKLWEVANDRMQGTDWVNHHPIVQIFTDKCAHLAGVNISGDEVMMAFVKCRKISEGVEGVY
jgi:hypothetical protein